LVFAKKRWIVRYRRYRREEAIPLPSPITPSPSPSFTFLLQHLYLNDSFFSFFSKASVLLFFLAGILSFISLKQLYQFCQSKGTSLFSREDDLDIFYLDKQDKLEDFQRNVN
jgi:hypothetical protein